MTNTKAFLKELINYFPLLLVVPYILGFITVNVYFNASNIDTVEAINLNYLIIGFFDLAIIFMPAVAFFITYKQGLRSVSIESILINSVLYSIIFLALGFFAINSLFVTYTMTPMVFILSGLGVILLFVINLGSQRSIRIIATMSLLMAGAIVVYAFINIEVRIKGFYESLFSNLLMGELFVLLAYLISIPQFKNEMLIKIVIGFVSLMYASSIIFSNGKYIPDLRMSIGGLKPYVGRIYLEKDCYFETKDSLSTEFRINNSLPVVILYNSKDLIVVNDSLYSISLERKCIKSIVKIHP